MTTENPFSVTVYIETPEDYDAEEKYDLSQNLLQELIHSPVEEASLASSSETLGGAKGDPITLGSIAVVVLPTLLPSLILLVQSWLLRQQDQSIKVKVGENEIEIPRDMPKADIKDYINLISSSFQSGKSSKS